MLSLYGFWSFSFLLPRNAIRAMCFNSKDKQIWKDRKNIIWERNVQIHCYLCNNVQFRICCFLHCFHQNTDSSIIDTSVFRGFARWVRPSACNLWTGILDWIDLLGYPVLLCCFITFIDSSIGFCSNLHFLFRICLFYLSCFYHHCFVFHW